MRAKECSAPAGMSEARSAKKPEVPVSPPKWATARSSIGYRSAGPWNRILQAFYRCV